MPSRRMWQGPSAVGTGPEGIPYDRTELAGLEEVASPAGAAPEGGPEVPFPMEPPGMLRGIPPSGGTSGDLTNEDLAMLLGDGVGPVDPAEMMMPEEDPAALEEELLRAALLRGGI